MSIAPISPRMPGSPRATFSSYKALTIFKFPEVPSRRLRPSCPASDHNSITFDHVGTFGNQMIVTCEDGDVFVKIDGAGTVMPIAITGAEQLKDQL